MRRAIVLATLAAAGCVPTAPTSHELVPAASPDAAHAPDAGTAPSAAPDALPAALEPDAAPEADAAPVPAPDAASARDARTPDYPPARAPACGPNSKLCGTCCPEETNCVEWPYGNVCSARCSVGSDCPSGCCTYPESSDVRVCGLPADCNFQGRLKPGTYTVATSRISADVYAGGGLRIQTGNCTQGGVDVSAVLVWGLGDDRLAFVGEACKVLGVTLLRLP